jgi:hypothetical protein
VKTACPFESVTLLYAVYVLPLKAYTLNPALVWLLVSLTVTVNGMVTVMPAVSQPGVVQ